MNELALFAGAGGGILGGKLLGWRTVCAVEFEPYAAAVLIQRQNDGILPPFPVWDDVRTFDGKPWRGRVDVVSGGFPCQDISAAGKGTGIEGERSGLWVEMARIIREVRPRFAFVENSPMLTSRGLGRVLGDLVEMGLDARWGVISAADVGAPHLRERIWIVAYSGGQQTISEYKGYSRTHQQQGPTPSAGTEAIQEREAGSNSTGGLCEALANTSSIGRIEGRNDHGEHDRSKPSAESQFHEMADATCQLPHGAGNRTEQTRKRKFANYSCEIPDTHIEHGDGTGSGTGPISQLEASEVSRLVPQANINDVQGMEQKSQPGRHRRPNRLQDREGSIPAGAWWQSEPDVGRVAHGVASRVGRLKAIGNGQVPAVAAAAFRILAGTES